MSNEEITSLTKKLEEELKILEILAQDRIHRLHWRLLLEHMPDLK